MKLNRLDNVISFTDKGLHEAVYLTIIVTSATITVNYQSIINAIVSHNKHNGSGCLRYKCSGKYIFDIKLKKYAMTTQI